MEATGETGFSAGGVGTAAALLAGSPPFIPNLFAYGAILGLSSDQLEMSHATRRLAIHIVAAIATMFASFLLTLQLPSLLTAPAERAIRIIHVVNRFYAASSFSSAFYDSLTSDKTPPPNSTIITEEICSLRTVPYQTSAVYPGCSTRRSDSENRQ
ncbi:hypothetical protein F5879DRAFT_986970 [Lentinula edodes]|nr:hypothetical protein F5879DRAFT_986970 [Lentinula edodes]